LHLAGQDFQHILKRISLEIAVFLGFFRNKAISFTFPSIFGNFLQISFRFEFPYNFLQLVKISFKKEIFFKMEALVPLTCRFSAQAQAVICRVVQAHDRNALCNTI
jgi:hypothetical protein